jgi:phenylalanyl-tRNA synthetase beta chain
MAFEVHLDAIPPRRDTGPSRGAVVIPDLQPVERDLAFVVDARTEAAALVSAAAGADPLIEAVRVFDVFEGAGLGEGRKSLAIAVSLQPRDATLTDEQIAAVVGQVVAKVEKATGGTLRS